MRKIGIIILFALIAVSVSFAHSLYANEHNQKGNPSPTKTCISDKYCSAIRNTDSIQWLIIDSWTPTDSAVVYLGHESVGEILNSRISSDSLVNKLTSEVLLSPISFQDDSVVKESVFMPDFGILYVKDSDSLLVSYSLYCDLCRFQNSEGYIDYNGENVRDELLILLKELFPKDKFVRNVTRSL